MMIKTKQELKDCLKIEKELYDPYFWWPIDGLIERDYLYRFVYILRHLEFNYNSNNRLRSLIWKFFLLKEQKKTCIRIDKNCFDIGLHIVHGNGILVTDGARIGRNCTIHSDVKIVSSGDYECPTIGNDCFLSVGATVVGGIKLADRVGVGANSTVVKDCDVEGALLVGTPARVLKVVKTDSGKRK